MPPVSERSSNANCCLTRRSLSVAVEPILLGSDGRRCSTERTLPTYAVRTLPTYAVLRSTHSLIVTQVGVSAHRRTGCRIVLFGQLQPRNVVHRADMPGFGCAPVPVWYYTYGSHGLLFAPRAWQAACPSDQRIFAHSSQC
jgi:hypothetical protein